MFIGMIAYLLVYVLLFAFGAVIGSFLNVVIYRSLNEEPLKKHESWVSGRSRCDHCHHLIYWYDNIPVLSFLVLRGKCRFCKTPIDPSHLVLEIVMGALFVWWFWATTTIFHLSEPPLHLIQQLFWLFAGVLLVAIASADWLYLIIPDTAVGILTVLALLYRIGLVSTGAMQAHDFWWTLVASLVCVILFALLWLGTKGRGFGMGDVKLIFSLGLLVGWPNIVIMMMSSFVLGSIIGVILIATKLRTWRQPVPFGPFLIAGTILALLWGRPLLNWYMSIFHL